MFRPSRGLIHTPLHSGHPRAMAINSVPKWPSQISSTTERIVLIAPVKKLFPVSLEEITDILIARD